NASYYMSFKHCVENPLKSSTYTQQMHVYKIISYILIFVSILMGTFCTQQTIITSFLRDILIIPVLIFVLYSIISMILNLVHNATTGDLYQNYQYFEINLDKATATLPEYVDYEVLFTQDEIRRGIPVLFEYIQKRAIEEQKELEKARIKNVEHEKFNFDESGLEASLVLERSMQEAENYIATRKKYLQDIEQINNEISALDNQYKENVKENQKLMQTSKESVDGLKQQLDQATSSIEINYIKKQMKDELNRQQVAERDFDALTDKHNKEVKALQEEIKKFESEIESAKRALETSMMSEFNTYSGKVYKKLENVVEEGNQEVLDGYKNQITELEEKLALKDEELDNIYSQYQEQVSQLEEKSRHFDSIIKEKDDLISQVQDQLEGGKSKSKKKKNKEVEQPVYDDYSYQQADNSQNYEEYPAENYEDNQNYEYETNEEFDYQNNDEVKPTEAEDYSEFNLEEQPSEEFNYTLTEEADDDLNFNYLDNESEESNGENGETFDYQSNDAEEDVNLDTNTDEESEDKGDKDNNSQDESDELDVDNFDDWFTLDDEEENSSTDEEVEEPKETNLSEDDKDFDSTGEVIDDELAEDDNLEIEEDIEVDDDFLDDEEESEEENLKTEIADEIKPIKRVGRPRKIVDEEDIQPKRKPGRPKKIVEKPVVVRKVGRPKKETVEELKTVRKVGRPRLNKEEFVQPVVRKVGRPRKEEAKPIVKEKQPEVRKVGRPRIEKVKPVGRPRKPKPVGRPRKPKPVGRPKKK
ncbi:MAG: hypothetical protein IJX26_03285, partial [Clostridia bacterium]|nr:hypothetical protein [Clostridia bacterium]